jgi:cytochrome P450
MVTTSAALARILHVLAQHPDVQERLRKEITESGANGGDVDYNDLTALPYLSMQLFGRRRGCDYSLAFFFFGFLVI